MKPSDSFKQIPEASPKTGESIVLHACLICGSVVINRKRHIQWHRKLTSKLKDGWDWPQIGED